MKPVHVGLATILAAVALNTVSGQIVETNLFTGVNRPVPDGTIIRKPLAWCSSKRCFAERRLPRSILVRCRKSSRMA